MGYALWLIPSPEEYASLEELMEFRPPDSVVKAGSKSYPRFAPHTTLATFPDLPRAFSMDDLPINNLEPPVLSFNSWKRGDNYLGALVVKLSKTPELRRLHEAITLYLDRLGAQWKSRNFPHMSLFYVDEPQERSRLEKDMEHWERIRTVDKRGHLVLDPHPHSQPTPITQFTGTEIWLVDCTRSVRQWKVMKKRVLSKPQVAPSRDATPQPDPRPPVMFPQEPVQFPTTPKYPPKPERPAKYKRRPTTSESHRKPPEVVYTRPRYGSFPSTSIMMPAPNHVGHIAPPPIHAPPMRARANSHAYQPQYVRAPTPSIDPQFNTRAACSNSSSSRSGFNFFYRRREKHSHASHH